MGPFPELRRRGHRSRRAHLRNYSTPDIYDRSVQNVHIQQLVPFSDWIQSSFVNRAKFVVCIARFLRLFVLVMSSTQFTARSQMSPTSLLLPLCLCFACIAAIRPGMQAQAAFEPIYEMWQPDRLIPVWHHHGVRGEQVRRAWFPGPLHRWHPVPRVDGYYEPGFGLQILNIFVNNSSLLVTDIHKLQD